MQSTMALYPGLKLDQESVGRDAVVLRPRGELDLFSSPLFQKRALAAVRSGAGRLVVDLSEVSFLDSAAISSLIVVARALHPAGSLGLVDPTGRHRVVLETVQMARIVPIYRTLASALELLSED